MNVLTNQCTKLGPWTELYTWYKSTFGLQSVISPWAYMRGIQTYHSRSCKIRKRRNPTKHQNKPKHEETSITSITH